jgi:hypothetical protein
MTVSSRLTRLIHLFTRPLVGSCGLPLRALILAPLVLQGTVSFNTISQGAGSMVADPREVVIRTQAEWKGFWNMHSSEPLPGVDFSASIVIGVFLGSRPTVGYEVAITAVRSQGAMRVVEYVERLPEPGAVVAQMLTSPYHIVHVPRDDANVAFRKSN